MALAVIRLLTEGLAIMLYVAIISYTYIVLSNLEVKGVLKKDSLYLHLLIERNESLSLSRQYFMFMLTFLFHKKC